MTGKYSNAVLKENVDVVFQYRNAIPMEFISFWNGGEAWTGHLLIMQKEDIPIEKAFALFAFRTLCLFEEWDINDTFSEDQIRSNYDIAVGHYDDEDIIKQTSVDYFMRWSNYPLLIDSSKEHVKSGKSYCQVSVNNRIMEASELNEFDPLKNYKIRECFQVKDRWNSQHYILVTDNEYIYYEGWTNA